MDSTIAKIGDNRPPEPAAILREQLAETHAPLIERAYELLGVPLPAEMNDDEEARISETIKMCTKFTRNSEVTRLSANEPHRALISATDSFFKAWSDKVEALKKKLTAEYLTPYQQKKKDEEQRRRDAEAAEAKRIADAAAEAERVEQRRLEAIRKAEDDARAAAERAQRQAADAKSAGERAAAAARQREAKEQQEKLVAERMEQEEAERKARDEAAVAQEANDKARVSASAKAADMSRSRSTLGAVASLRTTWKHEVVDAALVPRQYLSINDTAIAVAVRAATTKDGKNELTIPGIRIFPQTDSVVR